MRSGQRSRTERCAAGARERRTRPQGRQTWMGSRLASCCRQGHVGSDEPSVHASRGSDRSGSCGGEQLAASDHRHVSLVREAHSDAAYKEDGTGKRGIDCNYRLRMESVHISRLRRRRGLNVAASPSIADLSEQACASGCSRVHSPRCDTLRCQTGYCAPL